MSAAPTFFNNYSAIAAAGYDGLTDYVEVDTLPNELDAGLAAGYTQGEIEVPVTLTFVYEGVTSRLNMICRGYTDTPSKRLYVDSTSDNGTYGEPATVLCTLNRAAMASFQTTRQQTTATYTGVTTADIDVSVNTDVNVGIASTLSLVNGTDVGLGLASYQNYAVGLATTQILLYDSTATQPTITWDDQTTPGIVWEAGSAPQFQAGKTHLLITLVGGIYASVKHFA